MPGWQRDLAISYEKLADAYLKSEQMSASERQALAAGRAILAQLTAQHPEFAQWKKDLAWFDQQIAALKNEIAIVSELRAARYL